MPIDRNVNVVSNGVATKYLDQTGAYSTPAGGSGVSLKVNGTPNASQTTLNLVSPGVYDAGSGNVDLLYNISPDTHPAAPTAMDDEFESGSSINLSLWTWENQSGASTAISNGILSFTSPDGSSADNVAMLVQAVPGSTPWEVVIKYWFNGNVNTNYEYGGLVLRESGTGKIWRYTPDNTGLSVYYFSDPHTYGGVTVATLSWGTYPAPSLPHSSPVWLKIKNDGTNFIFTYSVNGQTYYTLGTVGNTSQLTPNQVGIGCGSSISSGNHMILDVDYFRRTL